MKHIYHKISGWFNFQDIYSEMVRVHDKGHFVEIGTFFGKSASYMATEIMNSKKPIVFDTIDTFKGSPSELNGKHQVFLNTDVEKIARNNLKHLPVNVIKGDSLEVSNTYKDKSLDFVFIDGAHLYMDVFFDIKHWKPKVKKGGWIGGHDYDNPNVRKAVDEVFKKECGTSYNSWLIKL